jgi:hypothetical protein
MNAAKKVTQRIRLTLVKSLALGGQYQRNHTGTFYGRRKDLEKLTHIDDPANLKEVSPEKA